MKRRTRQWTGEETKQFLLNTGADFVVGHETQNRSDLDVNSLLNRANTEWAFLHPEMHRTFTRGAIAGQWSNIDEYYGDILATLVRGEAAIKTEESVSYIQELATRPRAQVLSEYVLHSIALNSPHLSQVRHQFMASNHVQKEEILKHNRNTIKLRSAPLYKSAFALPETAKNVSDIHVELIEQGANNQTEQNQSTNPAYYAKLAHFVVSSIRE